nr:snaclec 3-like [Procambarus clarkii]
MGRGVLILALAFIGSSSAFDPLRQGSCPSGFLAFTGNKCLHVSTDYYDSQGQFQAVTWGGARDKCTTMSDHTWTTDLVYSLNEDIMYQFNDYVANNLTGMKYYIFWVGANRISAVSHWEWTDGQLVDSMSYVWYMYHPLSTSTNTKGVLVPADKHRFYMVDMPDTSSAPSFICEAAPRCNRTQPPPLNI